ncbi:MAG: hypothetical protein NZ561_11810 [Phycisphaerae bacterium]|nr:hypothetical protein [Phycisphaerae bacterium]MDW8261755.1 hypothetical protein [Phycisphaerales bacterium]
MSSHPVATAPRTGPLTVAGKLATFRGLKDVDPGRLVATIHWGDGSGGHAGRIVVNDDGSVDVFGAYTYSESPPYDISVQLSGGYELIRVEEGPRWMDWGLWDPGPTATYRHLYQFAWVSPGLDAPWDALAADPATDESPAPAEPAPPLSPFHRPAPPHKTDAASDKLEILQSIPSQPDA